MNKSEDDIMKNYQNVISINKEKMQQQCNVEDKMPLPMNQSIKSFKSIDFWLHPLYSKINI